MKVTYFGEKLDVKPTPESVRITRIPDRYQRGAVVFFRAATLYDGSGIASQPLMRGVVAMTPSEDGGAFYKVTRDSLNYPNQHVWVREVDIIGTLPPTEDLEALEAWLEAD